jgi:hypothetical protein
MEVKIDETYIQQGFPDHLAGFYTYLGSIPSTILSETQESAIAKANEVLGVNVGRPNTISV